MTKVNTSKIDDNLLYRRQFFFAPQYIEDLPNWNKVQIDKKYFLTIHPDLKFVHLKKNNVEIILLGFMLDPLNPEFSDEDIVRNLLKNTSDFNSVIKSTYNYSGRWIIVYKDDNDIQFFHDAAGSRQIFYTFHKSGVWCGSQPHTLANKLDIPESDDPDLLEFINSNEFEEDEHCMAGDGTIFSEILHLMPNHSLSINNQCVKRYWPDEPIPKLTMDEATDRISKLFTGLYESANNRFSLMQSVTAGVDSRALLAASKRVSKNITYFIQKFDKLTRFSPDISVPSKYLPSIGLDFTIMVCNEYDEIFDEYLKKNVYMIQSEKKKVLYYNFFKYSQDKVNVSGNIGGIIRHTGYNHYDGVGDVIDLAKLFNADKKKYVITAINKWLDTGIIELTKKNNIYLKDLFYWEHRGANWIPMFQTELDIAIDEWNPANCRNLIIASFAIPPDSDKIKERTTLYKNICQQLWPETLLFPISPPDYLNAIYIKNRLKKFIYVSLKKLHLLSIVKNIKHAF
ncbi:MAG: hypothetical protein KAS35_02040 [Candidatus Marinimicrobia bacterium]|nr:hypothetical protein [Candidatus Neomarinimicrobiota bacterium]